MTAIRTRSDITAKVLGIAVGASPDLILDIIDGSVSLDDGHSPYGEALLTVALPAEEYLELLDPRDNLRVELTATQSWDAPTRTPQTRTFNFLLHERSIDNEAGTVALVLESDEAKLIDYHLLGSAPERIYGLSVKDAVEYALTKVGATLEAGAADADVASNVLPPAVTNLAPSPIANLTRNWTPHSSTTGSLVTSAYGSSPAFRATRTTSSGAYASYLSQDTNPTLVDGESYTVRVMARSSVTKAGCIIRSHTGTSTTALDTATFDMVAGVWVEAVLTFTAQTARFPYSFSIYRAGDASGTTLDLAELSVMKTSDATTPYFDGDTNDTDFIAYTWAGTTNNSASTRTYVPNSDAMVWEPGDAAWDYVQPLLQATGLRLFCDESRKWRLVDSASYAISGSIAVSEGVNATRGTDLISLQATRADGSPVWYSGVQMVYRWTDSDGIQQTNYEDYAGTPGNAWVVEVGRPYPGPGAAAALLARAQGRGRTQELEALTDLTATPGMTLVSELPGTPTQVGSLASVEWKWSADGDDHGLMSVGSRGLSDTPETAWITASSGVAWEDLSTGTDWSEYVDV